MRMVDLRDAHFGVIALRSLVRKAREKEQDRAYLYAKGDEHVGVHVHWIEKVLDLASMQLAALEKLKADKE